jgi:hypothetical protein
MIRTTSLAMKAAKDLQPGELVRLSFGRSAGIGVLLKHFDDGRSLMGILAAEAFDRPMTWYSFRMDDECLSYGSDWVMDEIHGPETALGRLYTAENASLFIDQSGVVMRFGPARGGGYHHIDFSLNTLTEVELDRRAAPVSQWRLWESQDHFDRGGEPLFEMPVAKPA